MPYDTKLLRELEIVELKLWGSISGADLRAATAECVSLQRQTGATKFLIDVNGWHVVASVADFYQLPAELYEKEGVDRRSRIAVILPSSQSGQQAARDYEIMCRNRGWQAQLCPDRQSAIDWLEA